MPNPKERGWSPARLPNRQSPLSDPVPYQTGDSYTPPHTPNDSGPSPAVSTVQDGICPDGGTAAERPNSGRSARCARGGDGHPSGLLISSSIFATILRSDATRIVVSPCVPAHASSRQA
jgi:hypothetical protein